MRIGKPYTPLQDGAGGNELPTQQAGRPLRGATQQLRCGIVPRIANSFKLLA